MRQAFKVFWVLFSLIKNIREKCRKEGRYPAGHYYSPIPLRKDVFNYVQSRRAPDSNIPGINLETSRQQELLNDYIEYYEDLKFPEEKTVGYRYYFENDWFRYSDAIFLYCFLRKYKPNRLIEVGSGFSSALILDTVDRFFTQNPDMTFIDPYPNRLKSLISDSDNEKIKLIDKKIQDVPLHLFWGLESGDLLFIDSSHVVKCGSDLQYIFFEILPRLKSGVFVHFHDVFYPFDYPSEWLKQGRYWNENYFLRAFLSYNSEWQIVFFNTYAHLMFDQKIKKKMPLCARDAGGSLYIQRR